MDATKLKYAAALSMLLDHAAALFLAPDSISWLFLRLAGRLSFPIFAWFLAEGLRKTGDRKKYVLRLGLFALVSQAPYLLAFWEGGVGCSVMVTFFLAAGAMVLFEMLREKVPLPTALLPLLLSLLLAELGGCDYGALGVLLVSVLYLCGENRRGKLISLGLWSGCNYLVWTPLPELLSYLPAGLHTPGLREIVGRFSAQALPFLALCALFACLAIPLLARYNGERGEGHKWFFYWFYPLHLLALYLLTHLVP